MNKKILSFLLVVIIAISLGGIATAEESQQEYIDSAFNKAISDGIILGYVALENPLTRADVGFDEQYKPKIICNQLQTAAVFQRFFFGNFAAYPDEVLALAGMNKEEGALPGNIEVINKILVDNNIDFVFVTESETGEYIGKDDLSREEMVFLISTVKDIMSAE
jgi:hypothetical protein